MIAVRQATPADRPAIFDFIRRAYSERWQYKIPDRWQWEYIDNPFLDVGQLPVWIAVDEAGRVVGQTCALIEPLKLGNQIHRVSWSVDTYLDPQYRGQGIGYQLQRANDEAHKIFMSLSMSPANRRIKARLGSVPVDPVITYVRTLRHESDRAARELAARLVPRPGGVQRALGALLRGLRLDRALAATLNRRRAQLDARLRENLDPGVRIVPADTFDEELDDLWDRVSPHFDAIVRRDAVFLNWKFVHQPHLGYERYLARAGSELRGYVVLRVARPPEPDIGILTDLFAAPSDTATIMALLDFTVAHFQVRRVASITAASTVREYQSCLETFGFRKTKEVVPMVHCRIEGPACETALRPGSWFLGKGDHDWDQYPLA